MALRPLKITFEIEPQGIIYDPFVPIHLDGLIDWALRPMQGKQGQPPLRGEAPEELKLPLGKWKIGKQWGWCASALFPVGEVEEYTVYFRKKFRANRTHLFNGTSNLKSGPTREYNMPVTVYKMQGLEAFAIGDRKRIADLLWRKKHPNIRYLGQHKNRGFGRVVDINIEIINQDYSVVKNGLSQRWLPDNDGLRKVRLRPPYWNYYDSVICAEIGDEYSYKINF